MKVLAVTNMYPTPNHPGSGTFVEQQIAGLRAIGIDVTVVFADRRERGMAEYLRVPRLVRRAMASSQPDLVHVMYGGVLADIVTSVVDDRPTIVTFHGSDVLGEQLSGLARRCLAAYGVRASYRAARRARGIVVVADSLRQRLLVQSGVSEIRVIPCGIDLTRFRPMDRTACRHQVGWTDDRFHVLFNASGGDPVKRVHLARAAVARLNETGVVADLHEMSGLANDQVPVWMNASDVLLLTSLHEGSPTVVKEALACNRPVVSVDVGDVCERIGGVAGCHLSSAAPSELSGKLRLVHSADGGFEGRQSVTHLSLDRIASRVAEFYGAIVASCAA